MKTILFCFFMYLSSVALGQKEHPSTYYQTENQKYLVRITESTIVVYTANPTKYGLAVYDKQEFENTFVELNPTSSDPVQIQNESFLLEKQGQNYVLSKLNKKGNPKFSLELFQQADTLDFVHDINQYYLETYHSGRFDSIQDHFTNYGSYWGDLNFRDTIEHFDTWQSSEQLKLQVEHLENDVIDSVGALNVKYTKVLTQIRDGKFDLVTVSPIYMEIAEKDFDFERYNFKIIDEIVDAHPENYYELAGSIQSEEERKFMHLSLDKYRYRIMKRTPGDADVKREMIKTHRKMVWRNIAFYTVDFIITGLLIPILAA